MADKLLKSIKFPTLPDRYVIGDTSLSEEGAAAEAKATGDEITNVKDDLNKEISIIGGETFDFIEINANQYVSGWKLNPTNGLSTENSNYQILKFAVTPGSILKIISDDRFQLQNSSSVPSYGESNRIGKTYNTGEYIIEIPSEATYLIVSTPTNSNAHIYYASMALKPEPEYIFNTALDETITKNATSIVYYPFDFVIGQNYIVKITFSSFASTYNRKYSLRTTTAQYLSAAYTVQMIATIDGVNPIIGAEYAYAFKAEAKQDGTTPKYIALELSITGQTSCILEIYSVKAEDALNELNKIKYLTSTDIVSLNHDVPALIRQGVKPFNRATTQPLSLALFADIHGNATNLQRIVDMGGSLGSLIDDVVCGGDMVANNYSATCMDFWNGVDGAENILLCVGNHDLADGQHGYSSDQIGQTVAYQMYFSPYVSNWDVTMAGENLTYWYKDYASKKVRLIALNYLLTGAEQTAQNTWLASRLAEAKANGYAVVILEHTPLNSFAKVDCNFSIIGLNWGYSEFPTIYQDTVQSFIDGGGEFACYLAGHCHCDYVGYNSNYPDQLCVAVTTAQTTGFDNDQRRVAGEKSQDAMDIVLIDTVTKTVKLIRVGANMDCYLRGRNLFSINYITKGVIANS